MVEPAWPPDLTAWQPDGWSAFGTCLTALIAIVAALVAWRQVREAARLRREQAEPYVAVWMERSSAARQLVDLVVKNYGATAAYDVTIKIDPAPVRSRSGGQSTESVYIPSVIRTLVPGQEWRTFWDAGPDRFKAKLPDLHEVIATFHSRSGRRKNRHKYRFQLDWAERKGTPNIAVYGMHDAVKAMREVNVQVVGWTTPGLVDGG